MGENSTQTLSSLRLLILSPVSTQADSATISTTNSASLAKPLPQISPFPAFLQSLTGTAPSPETVCFAGYTSHSPLSLKNKYYAANVSLWCDELPVTEQAKRNAAEVVSQPTLLQWRDQMMSDEAREVRDVIGGLVLLLPLEPTIVAVKTSKAAYLESCLLYLEAVNTLREKIEDETGREMAAVAALQWVAMPSEPGLDGAAETMVETLEEQALSDHGIMGWDFAMLKPDSSVGSMTSTEKVAEGRSPQRNKYGESTGMARILEVLEGVDWSLSLDRDDGGQDLDLLASEEDFFDEAMFDKEFLTEDRPGLKPNINLIGREPLATRSDPVTQQSHEFQREMMGVRLALEKRERGEDDENSDEGTFDSNHRVTEATDDIEVEQLADMMGRVVAIKEAASEMSTAERQKFAKREIAKIMREMS